tara:strand:- start:952 stop:2982 length:2031 start_codon:yes stop_codon:yes gene_type:complete
MALQKTYSGDLTWSIAKQIGSRVNQAANMAADERAYASAMAEAGGTSLEEAGIGRGYFFRRALGSRFGGDAVARTRGRFEKNPPTGRNPLGTVGSRFRGGFDYNVSTRMLGGPLGAASGGGSGGGSPSGGGGGINPEVVPNDTILGKMINVTPGRGRSDGIVVHDQKLGNFVSAVAESLSASMNSMNTKADGIDQGVIAAKDGLTATQKQLEEVGDTLEDKLDAIIAEIRGQNNLLRKQEDQEEVAQQEDKIEQQQLNAAEKSGTDRIADVDEFVDDVKLENDAEDAAATASQQKMLPPAPPEAERGTFIAHGKELLGNNRVIDGPDTGYLASAEQGATSVTPINNFFTRGQTGAASKTGGMPSGKPVTGRKISSIGNIPEVKKETEKLAKAAVLPVQASGAMTLGILGQSMGEMGGIAGEKGVETGIKKMAAPIAGMFGVKNSIANNVAGEVGSAADAAKRAADTASGEAIKQNPFKGVFDLVGNTVNWVKSLFVDQPQAEKGGYVKSSSNMVSISAEKGAVINGPKTGYPVNIGGNLIEAHGKERVEKVSQGIQITPLDNFATDGIQGNEVTPGGDLNIASNRSFESGGLMTPSRVKGQRAQQAAMNSPSSNKTDIVQLNSKEREFNRMLTKVTKIDPIVINSTNSKTDPPPQEMQHIANKGDCALDLIYPPLV